MKNDERKELSDLLMALAASLKGIATKHADDVWMSLDLSMAQLKAFMIVVHTGGLPTRALAARMRVSPSAVTPVVDGLAAKKLVRREDDNDDRRVIWVMPTAKARSLYEKLNEGSRSMIERVIAGAPEPDLKHARQVLGALLSSATAPAQRAQEGKPA